jgi:hypothetical protein
MPKALSLSGLIVAILLLLIFALDLFLGVPFSTASKWMDVGMLISALVLGYLSWITFQENK